MAEGKMIKICSVWRGKQNPENLIGSAGDVRYLVLPNKNKKGPSSPDGAIYIAEDDSWKTKKNPAQETLPDGSHSRRDVVDDEAF